MTHSEVAALVGANREAGVDEWQGIDLAASTDCAYTANDLYGPYVTIFHNVKVRTDRGREWQLAWRLANGQEP